MFPHSIVSGRVWPAVDVATDDGNDDNCGSGGSDCIGGGGSEECTIGCLPWAEAAATVVAPGAVDTIVERVGGNCACDNCIWLASLTSWNSFIIGIPFAVVADGDHGVAAANRGTGRSICCHLLCNMKAWDSCGVCNSSKGFLSIKQKLTV